MSKMQKTTHLITDILISAGIDYVFGVPGGATPFLFEAIQEQCQKIKCIITRHEAAAACMADMYGRMTGRPGVLIGQGPWIGTNGSFGIVEAYLAGSPMVIITETSDWYGVSHQAPYQVSSGVYGGVDLPNIMKAMTKYTGFADTPNEVLYCLELALKHAMSGRPGPACVIARWNAMLIDVDPAAKPKLYPVRGHLRVSPPSIARPDAEQAADLLVQAKSPVMVIGRGVHVSRAFTEVQQLAEMLGMPVASSWLGKSGIPEIHPLSLGVMGGVGQKLANKVVGEADVILAVGTCLAPDNTDNLNPAIVDADRQKIIQIDVESRNAGWTYPITLGIVSDARLALEGIISAIKARSVPFDPQSRVEQLLARKNDPGMCFFTSDCWTQDRSPMDPECVVQVINELIGDNLLVTDAGNARMWFTNLFRSTYVGQTLGPGGAAGMGWGVLASLGAAMLASNKKVLAPAGDGSMMMALYALNMASQFNLPLVYLVLNNESLGNVLDFLKPRCRCLCETPRVDFAAMAKASGIAGFTANNKRDLRDALTQALALPGPALVDINVAQAPHFRIKK